MAGPIFSLRINQSALSNGNSGNYDVGKYNIKLTLSAAQTTDCSEHLVGLPAKLQAVVNSANTTFAYKHLIGRKLQDKSRRMRRIVPKADGRPAVEETFNISVLGMQKGVFEVKSANGGTLESLFSETHGGREADGVIT